MHAVCGELFRARENKEENNTARRGGVVELLKINSRLKHKGNPWVEN